jgi:hypothetical protein
MSGNEEITTTDTRAAPADTTYYSSSRGGRILKYMTILALVVCLSLFSDFLDVWNGEKQVAESRSKVAKNESSHHGQNYSMGQASENSTTKQSSRPSKELWIHVQSWREGIGHWTYSVSQLLAVAKKLNATIVEPGIENGRLVTEGNVWFSDIFNRSLIVDYHPKFATLKQFQEATTHSDANVFHLCFRSCIHGDGCTGPKTCENGIPSSFRQNHSDSLEKAMISAQIMDSHHTVLNIHDFWVNSFDQMYLHTNGTNKLVDQDEVRLVTDHHLRFVDDLYNMADSLLERMGISNGSEYAVIHWRAERDSLDYMECAQGIVRAKKAMNMPQNMTFVLISSLMKDPSMEWGGSATLAENTAAPQALEFLLSDHALQKIDNVLNGTEARELAIYVALDLIMSQKATTFATCTRKCNKPHRYCRKCNYAGNFALLAMKMREVNNKESLECWPQSIGEDLVYYNSRL